MKNVDLSGKSSLFAPVTEQRTEIKYENTEKAPQIDNSFTQHLVNISEGSVVELEGVLFGL